MKVQGNGELERKNTGLKESKEEKWEDPRPRGKCKTRIKPLETGSRGERKGVDE